MSDAANRPIRGGSGWQLSFRLEWWRYKPKPFDSDVLGKFKQCVEILVFAQGLTYLNYLFEHLPAANTVEQIEAQLPWNLKAVLDEQW
jgi:hypothetical protein